MNTHELLSAENRQTDIRLARRTRRQPTASYATMLSIINVMRQHLQDCFVTKMMMLWSGMPELMDEHYCYHERDWGKIRQIFRLQNNEMVWQLAKLSGCFHLENEDQPGERCFYNRAYRQFMEACDRGLEKYQQLMCRKLGIDPRHTRAGHLGEPLSDEAPEALTEAPADTVDALEALAHLPAEEETLTEQEPLTEEEETLTNDQADDLADEIADEIADAELVAAQLGTDAARFSPDVCPSVCPSVCSSVGCKLGNQPNINDLPRQECRVGYGYREDDIDQDSQPLKGAEGQRQAPEGAPAGAAQGCQSACPKGSGLLDAVPKAAPGEAAAVMGEAAALMGEAAATAPGEAAALMSEAAPAEGQKPSFPTLPSISHLHPEDPERDVRQALENLLLYELRVKEYVAATGRVLQDEELVFTRLQDRFVKALYCSQEDGWEAVRHLLKHHLVWHFARQNDKFLKTNTSLGLRIWLCRLMDSGQGRAYFESTLRSYRVKRERARRLHDEQLSRSQYDNHPHGPHEWWDAVHRQRRYRDTVEGIDMPIPAEAPDRPSATCWWDRYSRQWTEEVKAL